MMALINFTSSLLVASIICILTLSLIEAKRSKSTILPKCRLEECQLTTQHYILYSTISRAIENNFDLNGKEILPLLRSVEILKRRFKGSDNLNGTASVQTLLANESLNDALKVFNSDLGRALIDFYRSSINGRSQNLACSQQRIDSLERASGKLESDKQFALVFDKVHRNFLKKSAKKCLKHSCTALDISMSQLDSALGKSQVIEDDPNSVESGLSNSLDAPGKRREFEDEELKLCSFFMKSNDSNCETSARYLSEINLLSKKKEEFTVTITSDHSVLNDYLKLYYLNNLKTTDNSKGSEEQVELDEAGRIILKQCRAIRGLLDYNLEGLKWYRKQGLIDDEKLTTRSLWCPGLGYWLQVDRLCNELEISLEGLGNNGTFSYEVASGNKQDMAHTIS